jgi:hypothetical protein
MLYISFEKKGIAVNHKWQVTVIQGETIVETHIRTDYNTARILKEILSENLAEGYSVEIWIV